MPGRGTLTSYQAFAWIMLTFTIVPLAARACLRLAGVNALAFVGSAEPAPTRLAALRKSFITKFSYYDNEREPAPVPPPGELEAVYYDAPKGQNVAYVSPVRPGPRRPAIVWIQGGDCASIGASSWERDPPDNAQSVASFRKIGFVQMYPALRGAHFNAGEHETFLGEVDDVVAAGRFIASRPDVDPTRVYLGGHSTGATLVLLTAESTSFFRAVFALGPAGDIRQHTSNAGLPDDAPEDEYRLRSPAYFLNDIVTPTFIIEGEHGKHDALQLFKQQLASAPVHVLEIPNADHFDVIYPATIVIIKAINGDTEARPRLDVTGLAISKILAGLRR